MKQYSSIGKALVDIFPEIDFEEDNFNNPSKYNNINCLCLLLMYYIAFWRDKRNRNFLIKYANEREMNPFEPNTWSTISKKDVIVTKVIFLLCLIL